MNEEIITPETGKDKKETNVHKETYEWIQCVVVALVCCILIFVFLARVIDVKGHSMVPTLQDKDKLIITRLVGEYKRGDIVVLQKDSYSEDAIVKRIIAVAGQTIDIDFDAGIVYVDGEALDEPYINELTHKHLDFTGPVEVPEGCVFVMGDNRNNSTDSRRSTIGFVDTRSILGKAIFRILPIKSIGLIRGWEY